MKKYIAMLMVLALCICSASCGEPSDSDSGDTPITDNQGVNDNKDNGDKTDDAEITEEYVRAYKTAPASDFEYYEYEGGYVITAYTGNDDVVVIPATIDGKAVTGIAKLVFANDSNVRGVLIPNTVKTLDATFVNNAFIEVVICEGVEAFEEAVFLSCINLKHVILGNSLCAIGKNCFQFCSSLIEVYIAPTLIEISEYAAGTVFFGCENLTIVGEAGSYIEIFASEMGINFRAK